MIWYNSSGIGFVVIEIDYFMQIGPNDQRICWQKRLIISVESWERCGQTEAM